VRGRPWQCETVVKTAIGSSFFSHGRYNVRIL
jgi:hypothetical protein